MDVNRKALTRLLAEVLDSQIDTGSETIDEDRLEAALTTGPELTVEEKRLLCLSPVARAAYRRIRRRCNAQIQQRLEAQGLTLHLQARAASAEDTELFFENEERSFSVTLYRQPDADMPWMGLLRLGRTVQDILHPMTSVRLVDSGGLEWVKGRPDSRGELTFGWYHPDQAPDRRLREHALRLDIL